MKRDWLKVSILLIPAVSILYLLKFNLGPLPTNVFEVLIYVMAVVAFWIFPEWRKISLTKLSWLVSGLGLITVAISVFISPTMREALGIVKGWIIPALLVSWMLVKAIKTRADLEILLKGMLAQGVVVALIALIQDIPAVQQWWIGLAPDVGQYLTTHRFTSVFNSPNSAAMILAPTLIISWGVLLGRLKKLKKNEWVWWSVLTLVIAVGLISTGSRGGIVAAIFGVVLFELWRRRWWKLGWFGFAAALILFNPIVLSAIAARDLNNADIRVHIWRKSWELLTHHPFFGLGLGAFQKSFASYTMHLPNFDEFIIPYAVHPHNVVLYVWLSFGLLGLILFIFGLFRVIMAGLTQKTPYSLLGAVLIAVMLVHGMVDTTIFKNDLIIWLVAAVILAVLPVEQDPA